MEDLSLHVLDIAQNSILARARTIVIRINEDPANDRLTIEVEDDGVGMDQAAARAAVDPFATSRPGKKWGLGLPLLAEMARATGGGIDLESSPGEGTAVRVWFGHSHMDRQPLGRMTETIMTLVAGCPGIHVRYEHVRPGREFVFDTKELEEELDGAPLTDPGILGAIRRALEEALSNSESE